MVAQPDSIEISVVVKGKVLWDMLPEGRKIGDAPANFAYHVSQCGFTRLSYQNRNDKNCRQKH